MSTRAGFPHFSGISTPTTKTAQTQNIHRSVFLRKEDANNSAHAFLTCLRSPGQTLNLSAESQITNHYSPISKSPVCMFRERLSVAVKRLFYIKDPRSSHTGVSVKYGSRSRSTASGLRADFDDIWSAEQIWCYTWNLRPFPGLVSCIAIQSNL